ncbi:MAG: GFA family protein [Pseudomonadota bacterium]
MMMTETGLVGGCLCGAVRYRLASEPFDAGWCHCRTCQLSSGSPAMAFATVPAGDYLVANPDTIASVASSSFGRRSFCRQCGTPLTISVDHQPETIDFSLATLDEPQRVPPAFHIFYASRIDWAKAADDLPRHDRFRPDTRGLSGTEPPA